MRGFSFICTTGAPLPYASFAAVAFDGGCLLLTVWASSYLSPFSLSSRLVSGLRRSEPLFQLSSDSVRRGPPLPSVSQSQAGLLAEFLCPRWGVPSLSSAAAGVLVIAYQVCPCVSNDGDGASAVHWSVRSSDVHGSPHPLREPRVFAFRVGCRGLILAIARTLCCCRLAVSTVLLPVQVFAFCVNQVCPYAG